MCTCAGVVHLWRLVTSLQHRLSLMPRLAIHAISSCRPLVDLYHYLEQDVLWLVTRVELPIRGGDRSFEMEEGMSDFRLNMRAVLWFWCWLSNWGQYMLPQQHTWRHILNNILVIYQLLNVLAVYGINSVILHFFKQLLYPIYLPFHIKFYHKSYLAILLFHIWCNYLFMYLNIIFFSVNLTNICCLISWTNSGISLKWSDIWTDIYDTRKIACTIYL